MPSKDRRAGAGSTDFDWEFGDAAFDRPSQNLARFDHHAFFLARNIGDDILDNIERGKVAARPRDALHRRNHYRFGAEGLIQRLQRDCKTDRCAVGQRGDIAIPAAPAALFADNPEMVEINAWYNQRNVRLHTMGPRSTDCRYMTGIERLQFARRFRLNRSKYQPDALQAHRLRVLH